MKYIVMLGDGMADFPIPELNNKTPLEYAKKPNIDSLASKSELGLVKTVPDHLNPPGSDIANMSVLGYNPDVYYTGRSPLEAVSMNIHMQDEDLAIRCNLVTLSEKEPYEDKIMMDYSSDEITTEESTELIKFIQKEIGSEMLTFYPGISYRHCLIYKIKGDNISLKCTPPHDISGKCIHDHLPKAPESEILLELMKKSFDLLNNHPINVARRKMGLNPANSIWFWGEGRKPGLSDFYKEHNVRGAIVSAVDLLKGIAKCAGMEVINVEGATGNINTNFEGKGIAALDFLKNRGDFVYIHVEAPDESGHRHEIDNKVKAIEMIDEKIVGPILKELRGKYDFKMLVMPDHPTPLSLMTHTHDAVPYMIYDSTNEIENKDKSIRYTEEYAKNTGVYIEEGYKLMSHFIGKKKGLMIAFEGIDGSGKGVQFNFLRERLINLGLSVGTMDFPAYDTFFGNEIGVMLSGSQSVTAANVDVKSMSLWYAMDRWLAFQNFDASKYDIVLLNRSTLANAVYQGARCDSHEERMNLVSWIHDLEFDKLNIPKPNLFFVLDVSTERSRVNVALKGHRDYVGSEADVYEKNLSFLDKVRDGYLNSQKIFENVEIINCTDDDGNMLPIKNISDMLIASLKEKRYI